jgi:2-succinyl-5-enolpyruvyl-6-hydroxy-3-cyclohexene-1-carboxylate synthase
VHINLPFRKPLEPASPGGPPAAAQPSPAPARPYTRFRRGRLLPDDAAIGGVIKALERHPRGLIICGPDCPGGAFPAAVAALAETTGFPILADPLSNVRHGPQVAGGLVLGGYNLWLPALGEQLPRPEVILRFGTVPTSAALATYTAGLKPNFHLHAREDGEWADDQHHTDTYLQADSAAVCEAITAELARRDFRRQPDWAAPWLAAEARAWVALDEAWPAAGYFDGAAVARALATLPEDAVVFAGNSMPVRYVDAFDRPDARAITVYGNRGASGIDGNVSTALGLAAATGRSVIAFLGDITFYHDMNGLLAIGQHGLNNVTFVVTNNDGGGIFRRLPIARHDPPFTDLFLTPHGLTFGHAAALYGLEYTAVRDAAELEAALANRRPPTAAHLIEVITDGAADYERHRAALAAVAAKVEEISSADWADLVDVR